jgi:hypothetical protein
MVLKLGKIGFIETLFFVDVLGCFAPATAATPMAISLKNVCLVSLSLKEYPGFQQSQKIFFYRIEKGCLSPDLNRGQPDLQSGALPN